jgi:hypothetical protein
MAKSRTIAEARQPAGTIRFLLERGRRISSCRLRRFSRLGRLKRRYTWKCRYLFFGSLGCDPMRFSSRLPATALVWLVTAAMLIQPVVGLDCACGCHEPTNSCAEPVCDHGEDDSHTHGSCRAREQSGCELGQATRSERGCLDALVSFQRKIRQPSSPCNCPADCQCHALHEAPVTTVIRSSIQVKRDLVAAVLDVPACGGGDIDAIPCSGDLTAICRTKDVTSAQVICALYCRFTI